MTILPDEFTKDGWRYTRLESKCRPCQHLEIKREEEKSADEGENKHRVR